jgi:hypothetical protein
VHLPSITRNQLAQPQQKQAILRILTRQLQMLRPSLSLQMRRLSFMPPPRFPSLCPLTSLPLFTFLRPFTSPPLLTSMRPLTSPLPLMSPLLLISLRP